ncbi:MAG TPA: RNA polymerase sigma factor [Verrucomicrobiae bacterium]|nr:RNA polymerase sigma factor [Verrucomicrobiae bacterium]
MHETEADLAREAQRGDAAAFAALVRQHQRMIHSLTYRMTGSTADAEDLAQEAFLSAYEQIGSYRGQGKFSTWLYRIAINACLNWRQRETRRSQIYAAWASSAEALRAPDERESMEEPVQAALLKLPPKQRAAIVLTVCDGLDHGEAGKVLGCSTATVSWRVFAAKRKLKRWLEHARRVP